MMGRLKNESGFALILTLVVTALMVAVLVEMIHQVYVDTSISRGFRDGQQASILAESGVMAVKTALSKNIDPALLSNFLAKPLSDEVGSLEIKISDESGKININGLVDGQDNYDPPTQNTLLRLISRLKLQEVPPGDVLDSVADWIDKNDGPSSKGAETPYYRTMKPAYSARNDKLMTLIELTLVKGITPAMLDGLVDEKEKLKLRDCLTIYSNQQNFVINVNSASKAVLMALDPGISESVADQIINKRPFNGVGEFSKVTELDNVYRNSGSWGSRLTTTSSLFRVTAVAKVKESVRIVEAVVSNGSFLSWQEYW
ncbi:MAG: type II secretion system minor pseudopilin GspK [Steroidobacteraceae bacterium]|nr:type II secretion system minor pseudopilin GspK [Deltaproteobacteria bacterium]